MGEGGTETFELPLQGVAALQAHGYARTFGLLLFAGGVSSPEAGVDGATGIGIRIGHRYFIATAGHNLVGVPDSGLVLVHEDHVAHDPTPFLRRWPEASAHEPDPDVGYIELAAEAAKESPKEFVPLEQIRPGFNRAGVNVVVVGHPVERIPKDLLHRQRLINLQAMSLATATIQLPASRNPNSEFAIATDAAATNVDTGEPFETPSWVGMSGGGVWTFPLPLPSAIWSPSTSKLVGIEHTWIRGHAMVCTQMQHWLAVVASHYPELAPQIEALKA